MADGVDLGSARGAVTLDVEGFVRGIAEAKKQLDGFQSQSSKIGAALDGVSKSLAVVGGGLAVGIGAAVKTFADFEHTMSGVGASLGGVGTAAGITQQQFDALNAAAQRIGKDTAFSATDAAQAMDVLAKAGISADDIINGVADASVNLAAAIGEGIPQSAEAIAAALAEFSLSASDAADVTDTMTAAINASQTDLSGFVAGLRQLGPQMANLGIGFQDTAAAIAYFTKFGLKGADVGVSLARAIDNLAKPTDAAKRAMSELGIAAFDSAGKFVGFPALMDQLNRALAGASDETKAYALQTIFGAEASDVMAIAVRQGGDGLRQMTQQLTPAGQAATQAGQRLDNLSGSLEKMRGSVETAAIAFGSALAPAIEKGAGLIESLANAFSTLPPQIQGIAAATVASVAGFALLGAAVAKTIGFAIDSVQAFRTLATVIRESALAMEVLEVATGPVGIAIAAIAVALGVLVHRHQEAAQAAREHKQAIEELNTALESFSKFIADLRLQGLTDAANAAEGLSRALQVDINLLNEAVAAGQKGETGGAKLVGIFDNFHGNIDAMQKAVSALSAALAPMQEALQHTGINTTQLSGDFAVLVDQLFHNQISAEDFTAKVTDLTTHLDRYKVTSDQAGQSNKDQAQSLDDLTRAAEEAAKAYADFIGKVAAVSRNAVRQIKGLSDIGSEVGVLATGYQRVGETAADALLRMDRLGRVDISPADEQALHLANHLHDVEDHIAAVTAAIQQNQGDLSMWEDRIRTVTDVLGGNSDELDRWLGMLQDGQVSQEDFNAALESGAITGAFDKLDALLASGAISQDKYNKAKAAGIRLIERSAGGIRDENAELVDNLISLDAYVALHDRADGAVKALSDEQQGFLAAMQSSAGATALQTLQLLAYLAAVGLIPPEKVTDFIADASQADPVIAALFDSLGLLPDDKTTDFEVVGDGTQKLAGAARDHDKLGKPVKVDLDFSASGDGTEQLDVLEKAAEQPVEIPSKVQAPDDAAITGYKPDPIRVDTVLKAPLTDLLDSFDPDPVRVGTILKAPLTDLLDGYKPDPVEVPTVLEAPTGAGAGAGQPAETLTIPTALGAPDTAAVYAPATPYPDVEVPTKFGPPDDTFVYRPDGERSPVEIPTVFAAPPDLPAEDAPDPVTIAIDGDKTGFETALTEADTDGLAFENQPAYTALLDADHTDFDTHLGEADQAGLDFENGPPYTGRVDLDTTMATDALEGLVQAINGLTANTYSVAITADTSAAETAVANLAKLLPSSPAEEGPLAKTPSFAYVAESLAKSLGVMERATDASMASVMDSLRGGSLSPWTMGGLSAVPVGSSSHRSSVVNSVTYVALTEGDLQRLARDSAMGRLSHEWIADHGRRG